MSSYRGKDLFGSGPHRFAIGGVAQRTAEHVSPGVDGARRTPLGKSARPIEQTGTLLADDVASLDAQRHAIEVELDGRTGDLVDDLGRAHGGVVMLALDTDPIRRVGPRYALDYRVRYEQVQP